MSVPHQQPHAAPHTYTTTSMRTARTMHRAQPACITEHYATHQVPNRSANSPGTFPYFRRGAGVYRHNGRTSRRQRSKRHTAGRITTASSTHHQQQVHACTHHATPNTQCGTGTQHMAGSTDTLGGRRPSRQWRCSCSRSCPPPMPRPITNCHMPHQLQTH